MLGLAVFSVLLLTDPMDEGLWNIALSCGPSRRRTGQAFADWRFVLLVELLIWRQWPLAGNVGARHPLGREPWPAPALPCWCRGLVGLQRICPKRVTACDLP